MQVRGKAGGNVEKRTEDQIAEWVRSKDEDLNLHVAKISFVQSQQLGTSRRETGKGRSGRKHMCKIESL